MVCLRDFKINSIQSWKSQYYEIRWPRLPVISCGFLNKFRYRENEYSRQREKNEFAIRLTMSESLNLRIENDIQQILIIFESNDQIRPFNSSSILFNSN